ncbi:hypothetical protein NDU88_004426 [Pleurodeles waltl]|uniref:CCHC-type domain-containing protein n=1 Tax=Pleurodeles waltl TaxID=8319 RepID=A0AAV7W581_PLEWA|nr:hypothetical protein NDU88_004426 [Pleurodeles waltl]
MHCSFGPITDEIIRDQIIVHVRSRRIEEQLWVMGDPKLQDVINTAKALEQSEKWMKSLQGTEKNKLSDMDIVGAIGAGGSTNDTFTKKTTWSRKDDKNVKMNRLMCYRCGSSNHLANFPQCRAVGKECRKCKRVGHFIKLCREVKKADDDSKNRIACVCEERERGVVLSIMNDSGNNEGHVVKQPKCKVLVEGRDLELMADSGSPWAIITRGFAGMVFAASLDLQGRQCLKRWRFAGELNAEDAQRVRGDVQGEDICSIGESQESRVALPGWWSLRGWICTGEDSHSVGDSQENRNAEDARPGRGDLQVSEITEGDMSSLTIG